MSQSYRFTEKTMKLVSGRDLKLFQRTRGVEMLQRLRILQSFRVARFQ